MKTHTHKHIFYSDNKLLAKISMGEKEIFDAIVAQKLIKPLLPNLIFPTALILNNLTQILYFAS